MNLLNNGRKSFTYKWIKLSEFIQWRFHSLPGNSYGYVLHHSSSSHHAVWLKCQWATEPVHFQRMIRADEQPAACRCWPRGPVKGVELVIVTSRHWLLMTWPQRVNSACFIVANPLAPFFPFSLKFSCGHSGCNCCCDCDCSQRTHTLSPWRNRWLKMLMSGL